MRIKEQIQKSLELASGVKNPNLEFSSRSEFGDYTTNIALRNKDSKQFAKELVNKLNKDESLKEVISKIEILGSGFINFHLSTKVISNNLSQIMDQKNKYGDSTGNSSQKIMIEYGDANTHKLPHIGHLFSYIYGESLARILEVTGHSIKRASYQGDVGPHVAKCLWALQKENPEIPSSLEQRVYLLQEMYQLGSKSYDEDSKAKDEITRINKEIYDPKSKIYSLWKKTRDWNVEYYQHFENTLNINYDKHYYESEVYQKGKEIVEDNIGKVFIKSQEAIIFPGSKYGLHDRVFITRYGTPTYEAKEIYLEKQKKEDWPADTYLITTASEQNGYFKVVFKALETLDKYFVGKLKHIGFGMVNLKSGKMSSRTGNIISAIDLIKEVKAEVKALNPDPKTSEEVALGAIKYSFLKNNPLQNITFSVEESIAKEGNSGPYLQYTHARTQSVLNKATKKPIVSGTLSEEEIVIGRQLIKYPEVIEKAATSFSPNIVANYLYELASSYNTYYNKVKIIGSKNEESGLAITCAVGQVLKNGLNLLGIETPKKM